VKTGVSESELRDVLADNIQVLEPGLVLLNKEAYVPNRWGTRGFIDLLARDTYGHYVLIELKKSDNASREAIHEILKYAEGVKQHLGARDDEVRVIIASTEWKELMVPFSRFITETNLSVLGVHLSYSATTKQITAAAVPPLVMNRGRFLAPWHEVNFYETNESLARGISTYESSFNAKGIHDYVMLLLHAPGDGFPSTRERTHAKAIFTLNGEPDSQRAGNTPKYKYLLYVASQILEVDQYLSILSSHPDKEEVKESINRMDEEEKLCFLHERVGEMDPNPERDYFEIGYPAKLKSRLFDDEGWIPERLRRYGTLERNTVLSDEEIIEELCGAAGVSKQRFKRTIVIGSRAHLASAMKDLEFCLQHNPVWRAHLRRHLNEIVTEYSYGEAEISVFNPSAGLVTLYLTASRENGNLYLPTYTVAVRQGDRLCRVYMGFLEEGGEGSYKFEELLSKYYGNDIGQLLTTLLWGGYEARDTEILEDAGLVYRSFHCDFAEAGETVFHVLRDERWRASARVDPVSAIMSYMQKRRAFMKRIIEEIGSRWDGEIFIAERPKQPI
jgi:hypothetical protein